MKTTDSPLRVGIVGAGANTRSQHIPRLRLLHGIVIAAVANRRRESSEAVAHEFGIPAVYDRWEELVAAPDLDAVVIGTWPNLHCEVTVAALDAGKHVLCEARLARNTEEARRMCRTAARHPELVAQVVPSPFTLHADRTIQRLLHEGYLGRLLAAEVRVAGGTFADPDAPLHWRQDAELSGVNTMSLGIWYEALMRWVGEAETVAAQGIVAVPHRREAGTGVLRTVIIPDYVSVVARMECGIPASFLVSAISGGVPASEALLLGTEGTLRFSEGRLYGQRRGETGLAELNLPKEEAVGWRVEAEFVDAIRGLGPVERTTFGDGFKYMAFTEAVIQSLSANQTIRVATS